MFLGLDVGGTHTDAVLLDEKGIIASYKAPTNHDDLILSMNTALFEVTKNIDKSSIKKINLSTTLSTNAIIEGTTDPVGLLISSGPGINPQNFSIGPHCYLIDGSIDHRGTIIKQLNDNDLNHAVSECKKNNISVFASVTKFSTRNPVQETFIGARVEKPDFITYGHKLSGQLSFPRRIATAYFNSAVWRIFNNFANAIEETLAKMEINAEINILKADGGTMPLNIAREKPVESILSGPAASIMGIISLCTIAEDSIILDIGGTTTDIAIFASGFPLIEQDGIALGSHPTLVRSLKNSSIGIGGDSILKIANGAVSVGPERKGPSMADDGPAPTLIDAFNAIGKAHYKDINRSIEGLSQLAQQHSISPKDAANNAISFAVNKIKSAVDAMLKDINEKPVYTIHEMLDGKKIVPNKIYLIGGPADAFNDYLAKSFDLEVTVPDNFAVANAIGAAIARTTIDIELFADTGKKMLLIPSLGIHEKISSQFSLKEAEKYIKQAIARYLSEMGADINPDEAEIVESTSFNMVSGFYSSGQDIRVKCQVKPGVVMNIYSL